MSEKPDFETLARAWFELPAAEGLRKAYAEGERSMRERVAKMYDNVIKVHSPETISTNIRAIPIQAEEGE